MPGATNPLIELAARVRACFRCSEMAHVHVLSPANGDARARVMFIGEAPGRLGASLTGIPFSRDQSGLRFERLLRAAGLTRAEVFVTNAVLCNPLRDGRNRAPTRREIASCAHWLKAQVDLVDPALVVTLGNVALSAARLIEPHGLALRRDVGRRCSWYGRTLLPLYHPSARTSARRPFSQQAEDWKTLRKIVIAR